MILLIIGIQLAEKKVLEKTMIGNNVSIGSNATILPVKICNDVIIGAGSVTKNINKSGIYVEIQLNF